MKMIKKSLLYVVLLVPTAPIISMGRGIISARQYHRSAQFALLDPGYDRKKIVVNSVIDSALSRYISFITDGERNRYVIKQKRKSTIRKQFQVVLEKLSGHIAETLDIPAHRVQILPAGMAFPGKILTDKAASILTLVPGIPVKEISGGPYAMIDLRQSNRPDWPKSQLGLNKRVIASMGLHSDLALMAALDTFIGNKGRHEANYFYDEKTNRFYAIDMDKIYNSNGDKDLISKIACDQIRGMLRSKKVLRQAEFDGLTLYRDTLQRLVDSFPPARIYELLDEFASLGGFDKKAYVPELVSRVGRIKAYVQQSHGHIVELIKLVSQLINQSKRDGGEQRG